eukprot:13482383-Alexandrium_andersonii.AAC.1
MHLQALSASGCKPLGQSGQHPKLPNTAQRRLIFHRAVVGGLKLRDPGFERLSTGIGAARPSSAGLLPKRCGGCDLEAGP